MADTECTALLESARKRLTTIYDELQIVFAGIIVAAGALRHQNAEQDEEVARVLVYSVGDRLSTQLDRTAELLASLDPIPTHPEEFECVRLQ